MVFKLLKSIIFLSKNMIESSKNENQSYQMIQQSHFWV